MPVNLFLSGAQLWENILLNAEVVTAERLIAANKCSSDDQAGQVVLFFRLTCGFVCDLQIDKNIKKLVVIVPRKNPWTRCKLNIRFFHLL